MSQAPNTPASTSAAGAAPAAPVSYAPVAVAGKRGKPIKEPAPLPIMPTAGACVFAGSITLILGALLAALHLAARPVERVAELPAKPDHAKVYYVPGAADEADSQRWLRKRQQLLDGPSGEIKVTESDLNVWAQSSFEKTNPEGSFVFAPGVPNFRLTDGQLQITLEGDVHILGLVRPILVKASGKFSGKNFSPDEIRIGALPTSRIPGLAGKVQEKIDEAFPSPSDLSGAWGRLENATIDGKTLVLKVP
ncbi:hypothetical protein Ga0100231_020550 [Opitutaceae bacterium TAV4]|nr:hypothetical protein Ga0100231_020550 [Opitutaceae bacterium TAV4]RRK00444.1 hypothetical protein Ga0100230_021385 [Opitutaceae bacterium TAV3]